MGGPYVIVGVSDAVSVLWMACISCECTAQDDLHKHAPSCRQTVDMSTHHHVVGQFISSSAQQFISLSVHQFVSSSVCQFISFSVHEFISSPDHQFIRSAICQFIMSQDSSLEGNTTFLTVNQARWASCRLKENRQEATFEQTIASSSTDPLTIPTPCLAYPYCFSNDA